MKTNRAIWIVGVLVVILTNQCRANLNGSDDFNGAAKDTTKWATDLANGVGRLTQTNGHLQFTTTGVPTQTDFAARPWMLNYGSYTQDWEFRIDVNEPIFVLTNGQFVGLTIAILPGTDPSMLFTNAFSIQLRQNSSEHSFKGQITANQSQSSPWENKITTSTSAAMRIAFDANTQVLSCFYDEDGSACGYSWTLLGSTNVPAGWNMTSNSVFGILVVGIGNNLSVDYTNNVFADNFRASSGNNPNLRINRTGSEVALSWATNGPTIRLESTSTLSPPICWQVVTNTPGIAGTNFTVTNVISNVNKFYRLSR